MCVCSASCQCICRVRTREEMWLSNSEFGGVGWEITTGNKGDSGSVSGCMGRG